MLSGLKNHMDTLIQYTKTDEVYLGGFNQNGIHYSLMNTFYAT